MYVKTFCERMKKKGKKRGKKKKKRGWVGGGGGNMQVLEKFIRNISSCNNKYAHGDGTNFDDVTS